MGKTWAEMTDAERAEINRQESEKERRKASFHGATDDDADEGLASEPTDEDLADIFAPMEERVGGHKDSFYW